MRFAFTHSHAFEGAQVDVEDDDSADASCLIAFGDGSHVVGTLSASGPDAHEIDVPEYRTAAGTLVTARRWRIARRPDGVWRAARIG
jgi:hypothetical protein